MAQASSLFDPLNKITINSVIAPYITSEKDFIMRCSSAHLSDIMDAVKKGKPDQIITIKFCNLSKFTKRKLMKNSHEFDENTIIKIRVLLFKLSSGEQKILLTSLLDKKQYPPIVFYDLYGKRWDIEESYKFEKTVAEIENFSGKSKLTIEQDFYATVLTCNVAQMLMQEVQDEINEVLD